LAFDGVQILWAKSNFVKPIFAAKNGYLLLGQYLGLYFVNVYLCAEQVHRGVILLATTNGFISHRTIFRIIELTLDNYLTLIRYRNVSSASYPTKNFF